MNNEERIISLLEDLVAWQRLAARENLLPFLKETLADPKHLIAYELTDGTRKQQQVADGAGLSQPAVSGLWTKWRRQGILIDKGGKTMHIVRPSDYGMDVPAAVPTDGKAPGKKGKAAAAEVPVDAPVPAVDGAQPE